MHIEVKEIKSNDGQKVYGYEVVSSLRKDSKVVKLFGFQSPFDELPEFYKNKVAELSPDDEAIFKESFFNGLYPTELDAQEAWAEFEKTFIIPVEVKGNLECKECGAKATMIMQTMNYGGYACCDEHSTGEFVNKHIAGIEGYKYSDERPME